MSIFNTARLTLTAWYLILITLISLLFSVVLYRLQVDELNRFAARESLRIQTHLRPGLGIAFSDESFLLEAKARLIRRLGLFNLLVIILSGGLGYFLAGRTLEPIEVMVREQKRFVSDAAHELRTPLTAIKSSLEVYERDPHPSRGDTQALIKDNLQDVDRLEKLTSSLLSLSQLQHDQNIEQFVPIDLSQVASRVVKSMGPIAKKKQITLHLTESAPIMISGIPSRIIELATILVDNAVKYSDKDNGKVTISISKHAKKALLVVQDKGIGIAQTDLPHIFDRFYRSDSARVKEDIGGYGLGLAIAQKIVQTHHGSIMVKSKLGIGTTFTVSLPLFS